MATVAKSMHERLIPCLLCALHDWCRFSTRAATTARSTRVTEGIGLSHSTPIKEVPYRSARMSLESSVMAQMAFNVECKQPGFS